MFNKNIAARIQESNSISEMIDIAVEYPEFSKEAVSRIRNLKPKDNLTKEEFFRLNKENNIILNRFYVELVCSCAQFTNIGEWIREK